MAHVLHIHIRHKKFQCVSLLRVIKIKIKAYQFSKVNLSYTVCLRCLSILGMLVASERLISCFTSARDGLDECWKGEKKGQGSRNTLMQMRTVKVICLAFKTAHFPTKQPPSTAGPGLSLQQKHLYMDRHQSAPRLAASNSGQTSGQNEDDDETPAGIRRSVVCLPLSIWT